MQKQVANDTMFDMPGNLFPDVMVRGQMYLWFKDNHPKIIMPAIVASLVVIGLFYTTVFMFPGHQLVQDFVLSLICIAGYAMHITLVILICLLCFSFGVREFAEGFKFVKPDAQLGDGKAYSIVVASDYEGDSNVPNRIKEAISNLKEGGQVAVFRFRVDTYSIYDAKGLQCSMIRSQMPKGIATPEWMAEKPTSSFFAESFAEFEKYVNQFEQSWASQREKQALNTTNM